MNSLTPQQIDDLLLIGFNIRCDEKVLTIDRSVLYLLLAKAYKLGLQKGKESHG